MLKECQSARPLSVHKFDLIGISETMLNSTIGNDVILTEGFSREIYRADHPSDNKIGGVFFCFRESLPIKRWKDLEFFARDDRC